MDDPVAVALEGAARAALLAASLAPEFSGPVGVRIGSIGGAGHHGTSD
jgi:hypothetical protein